ncbi:MAG: SAM-dependent methyltransferase, partial [Trueperella pyogenes]|nr:SAM-dependent methyltransferase [Trueperella pyogenes]
LPARPLRGKELGKWRAGIRPLTDEAVGWTQSAL